VTASVRELRPPGTAGRRRWDTAIGDVVVACVVSLVVLAPHMRMPEVVERVAISNGTPYHLDVAVSDAEGDRWLRLTTVESGSTRTITDVIDQGDTWTFRFRGQGRAAGEVTIGRAALDDAGWTVEVPAAVAETLRQRGAVPSP
jgi:hypothetical protein